MALTDNTNKLILPSSQNANLSITRATFTPISTQSISHAATTTSVTP
ncbi:hypothetical protein, unlikely [Trypanosoma brucei brucei TREU927]|uniref:Uncharacterized protein n=1 Tax=Trypanosoma brucei brucei (strain 927/4 GUTat10.1) TaxID=185431 RepID=Q38FD2_TRYB2|nr:hypothetical protein, unlikely [Trypanosoma brucei brucei TREU927]EAN76488.1 hypothetical protein, unlikely [Trypanosoma brucei brucei TREU927]